MELPVLFAVCWNSFHSSGIPLIFNASSSPAFHTHKGHVRGLLALRAKCLCLARIKDINQIASAQSAIREAFHFICQLKALRS